MCVFRQTSDREGRKAYEMCVQVKNEDTTESAFVHIKVCSWEQIIFLRFPNHENIGSRHHFKSQSYHIKYN